MESTSDLYEKRIALTALTDNTEFFHDLCHHLHDCAAHLTAVSIDGQLTSGWDAGESMRISSANSADFVALILILDSHGVYQLENEEEAVRFVNSILHEDKPVICAGESERYLIDSGLLSEISGSDDEMNKLIFAPRDVSAEELASIVRKNLCEKLNPKG